MLVSVIIPVYNGADYIRETVASVLNQSYKKLELILLDDGSKDNTLSILNDFDDERVTVISKTNSGVSDTRNTGAKAAKGDYFAFLDADDVWHVDYLQKKIEVVKKYPKVNFVLAYFQCMDANSVRNDQLYPPLNNKIKYHLKQGKSSFSTGPSNVFCSRELFDQTGGFDTALSNAADKMFFVDAAPFMTSYVLEEVLIYYRVHDNNMHNNLDLLERDSLDYFDLLKGRAAFVNKKEEQRFLSKTQIILGAAYRSHGQFRKGIGFYLKALASSPKEFFGRFLNTRKIGTNVLYRLGLYKKAFRQMKTRHAVPILLFHRIHPIDDPAWNPIFPDHFEAIVLELKKHFDIISIQDALDGKLLTNGKPNCCIAFDDAFKDFENFALPVLRKQHVPVTLFVPTKPCATDTPIWTSKIDNLVLNRPAEMEGKTIAIANQHVKLNTGSDLACFQTSEQIKTILQPLTHAHRETELAKLACTLSYQPNLDYHYLNFEALNRLKSEYSSLDFGSHTVHHPFLESVTLDELTQELKESKATLEQEISDAKNWLAYPIGSYNETVIGETKQFYDYAFSVSDTPFETTKLNEGTNRYAIPRYNIYVNDPKEVVLQLSGVKHRLKRMLFFR